MNRNFPAYQNDEGFRRIAVLLVNLAVLAEMAGLRSLPVRWLMLWLMRPAEEAARGFAIEAGWIAAPLILADDPDFCPHGGSGDGSDIYANDGLGDSPDEAARLAWMFRALAAFFFDLSYQAANLTYVAWQLPPGCLPVAGSKAAQLYSLLDTSRPRYADTS